MILSLAFLFVCLKNIQRLYASVRTEQNSKAIQISTEVKTNSQCTDLRSENNRQAYESWQVLSKHSSH